MSARWTDSELEFLHNYAGILNHKQLSKKLHRSIYAIRGKQYKEGIRFLENFYTYTVLARELGKSRNSLRKWRDKGFLRGKRASWATYYGKTPMIVFTEDNIVLFLSKHYHRFDYKKVPNKYFSNIIRKYTEQDIQS